MKKRFLLPMLFLAWAPGVWAQSTPSASGWYLGLGTGLTIPTEGWGGDYELGQGGDLFAGLRLGPSLALQGDVQQWWYTGGGHSTYNPRFLGELKGTLPGGALEPYGLLGFGFDLQSASPSGDSTLNLDALAGVGIQAPLGEGKSLFLEAFYNLTLTQDGSLGDIPLLAGIEMGI